MTILLVAALIAILPAYIAHSKGRSFLLWWVYGVAICIIALPHSLLMKSNKKRVEQRQLSQGMRKCVYCAEMIKREAKICRFCGKGRIEETAFIKSTSRTESSKNSLGTRTKGMSINDYYKEQR